MRLVIMNSGLNPILFIFQTSRSNWCTGVMENCNDLSLYFIGDFSGLGHGYILEGRQIERHFVILIARFKKKDEAILFMVLECIAVDLTPKKLKMGAVTAQRKIIP